METAKKISIVLVLIIAAFSAGRFSKPKEEDKKTQTDVATNVSKDISTTTTTEIKPDGTKVVTVKQDTKTDTSTNTNVKVDDVKKEQATWKVALGTGYNFQDKQQVYMLNVNKKVVGGVSVGVFGLTDKTVGVDVQVEF